jgi:hypothetical protein
MFIETQNTIINSKKCLSCRRNLNYEFFGESKSSKDGFNSNCRMCRNQSRRQTYNESVEAIIFNLMDANQNRCPNFVNIKSKFICKAICIENWTEVTIKIEITKDTVMLKIVDLNNKTIFTYGFITENRCEKLLNKMRTHILKELHSRSLRLYKSSDELHTLKIDGLLG